VDQGILPFAFEAAQQPMDLTAFAGLTLVSETMLALCLDDMVQERLQLRKRRQGYNQFDKLHALVLVQAARGDCLEDVRIPARDAGLVRLLGRSLPSPDSLHDFLGAFHDKAQFKDRPGAGAARGFRGLRASAGASLCVKPVSCASVPMSGQTCQREDARPGFMHVLSLLVM
jgi:hypothetical protein